MKKDKNDMDWVIIKSHKGIFDFDIQELIKYRDLIFLFVKRTFVARYKQTILGPLWAVFQPLLTTIIFTAVFGSLANLTTLDVKNNVYSNIPSFLFYLSGTICWSFFSSCLTETSNTFISNSSILSKVYFPRLVMPISTILSQFISFFIQFVLFCFVYIYFLFFGQTDIKLTLYLLFIPLLIIQMGMLALGFGIIISSLTTKYRDLAMLISFGLQLWQYATPVVYGLSLIPDSLFNIYFLNPMSIVIVTFRYFIFGVGYFNMYYYLYSWIITFIVLFFGIILFNRVERTFVDTV